MKDAYDNVTIELLPEAKVPKRRGRPSEYISNAERQKAYRARLKEKGMREVRCLVRDVRGEEPLKSDVIDLSEVRKGPPKAVWDEVLRRSGIDPAQIAEYNLPDDE